MISSAVFHDATIARLSVEGSVIHIEVNEFALSPVEMCPPTRISIRNCREILRDGLLAEGIVPESEDGEIYRIEEDAVGITLMVIWFKYKPRTESLVAYKFVGADLDVTAL